MVDLKRFHGMFWREFWILPSVGNAYAFVHTKCWLLLVTLNYVVAYTSQIGSIAMLAYTSFLMKDRISVLSQSAHLMIVGAVSMTASVTLSLSRKKIQSFETLFCDPESFAPYNKSEYFDSLMKQTTNKKNYYIKFWFLMYGTCGLIGICQPLINSLANTTIDEPVVNGVWIDLPIAMWAPFDLENDLRVRFLFLAFEGIYMFYCPAQVICAIVLCFTASDRLLDQFKSCIWGIRHLDKRAKEMLEQRYPRGNFKNARKEFDECYYDCLVQNVKHHSAIMKEYKKFLDLVAYPIAVPFLGGAMLLGMALITVTAEDDPRIGPKCLAMMLALSEAINMYNLCNVGQEFQDISDEIFEALFYTTWYKRSAKCRRAIVLMRCSCTRPLKLTATRFLTLNIPLFSDLVNSAYSLFNLLNASKSGS